MTIRLHCFGESGNAYKAALALELSGLEWEPVFVDFFGGASRSDAFRTMNVMGEAPVLEDGDIRLTQSGVIQQYITDKSGKFGGAAERGPIAPKQFGEGGPVDRIAPGDGDLFP